MVSRFSRREVISAICLATTGTVVVSSVPFLKKLFISKAQAQEISEEVYKGRRYKIITNQNLQRRVNVDNTFDVSTQLFIDEKEVRILQHKKTKKYLTPLLFGEFENPKKIAITIIDLNLKFPIQEVKIDPDID